jgi:hypothetical protein
MSDELEFFDQLLKHWRDGSEYASQSLERKLEEGEVAQRIRQKLIKRPVGRPKKFGKGVFTARRVIVYDYLEARGESRKSIKRAVMAEIMGWSPDQAREFDRTYDPSSDRWRRRLKWMRGRGWQGISEARIDRAYARVLETINGNK